MKHLKQSVCFLLTMGLLSMAHTLEVYAADNLIKNGKTDSAIKPLVFPQSMVVIRSCHPGCLSLESDQKPVPLSPPTTTLRRKRIEALFAENKENHRKAVQKWLVRLDPARIAPANRVEDFKANVSRKNLKLLGEKNPSAAVIFLFHQSLVFNREPWVIRTRGLLYLAQQDKLIALNSNDQNLNSQNELEKPLVKGLEELAIGARKTLLSYKFEKRRSNY